MSEAVSALNGAVFDGLARVEECGLQGMITLRGDLASRAVAKAATSVSGQKMPAQNHANVDGEKGICWMSPDELLVLVPYAEAGAAVEKMTAALGKAHSLAVNVSDARAVFRLSGPAARDVLAKLCPVDLSPEAFGPGQFRRTRLAQVPAAFWMDDGETFRIVCFRSVAQYVFDLLKAAAHPAAAVDWHARVSG